MAFDIAGKHAFADIMGGPVFTSDWSAFCREAVEKSKIHVVAEGLHTFADGTQTVMYVLSESSFIATLSADGKSVKVHCYTCGEEGDPMQAVEAVCEAFPGAAIAKSEIVRGNIPQKGILTNGKQSSTGMTIAVSDVIYKKPITDQQTFRWLNSAVALRASSENMEVLQRQFRYKGRSQGRTAIIAFQTASGAICHVDMHTYPEHNYVSYTAVGPGRLPFNTLAGTRSRSNPVVRGNLLVHGRQNLAIPAPLFAMAA